MPMAGKGPPNEPPRAPFFDRGRRPTVRAYLLTAFAVSVATLVAVTVMTTRTSFQRERDRVETELRSAAQREVDLFDDLSDVNAFFEQMASQPAMVALDAVGCQAVFDSLRGLIDGHVHLLRADGSEVCRLTDDRAPDASIEPGPWLDATLAREVVVAQAPAIDPDSGTPATLSALRVVGPNGPVGVVAAVLYTGMPPIDQPRELPKEASIFVVDPDRSLILATTPGQLRLLGTEIKDRPVLAGSHVWVEATGRQAGWHALATLPKNVALADANAELRRTLLVGSVSVAVVLLLGMWLHRRLARPIRRLGGALLASLEGDEAARAPVEGPAEVAEAAHIFNVLIAERHAREAELEWKASHDALTGLPNRAALTEGLDELLVGAGADDLGVLFLDLDRFKLVNDSHGHAVGDRVLVSLGHRLATTLDGCGTLSRFGGDEFVAVCPSIGGHEGAVLTAHRMADTLKSPIAVDGQEIWLAGSVGIALVQAGDRADDMIRNADTAMYRAKENGRGQYAVFDERMRESVLARLGLERDLNRALERHQLLVHYQPKFSLESGALVGVEALARWRHPERGMVSPGEFIPVAEDTGLIVPLGRWVLEEAAAQARRWRLLTGRSVPVAVNLSSLQLAVPGLVGDVADVLRLVDALPSDVMIEITESSVLQDVDGASERLGALREIGVRVSIDDFGTGYSSLSYLQLLPIDELKIDRSFVERLDAGPTAAIVGSIIDLAHALQLSVVAEGIETDEQLVTLRRLGCDLGQGFHLARPQPAEVVSELLLRPFSAVGGQLDGASITQTE